VNDDKLDGGVRQNPLQRGPEGEAGEARGDRQGGELSSEELGASPTWKELMEEVAPANIARAMKRVVSNQGSPGIDGMTVHELANHWQKNEESLRTQLLAGTYKPTPSREDP
jgi:RNA-directed DNA polymerase